MKLKGFKTFIFSAVSSSINALLGLSPFTFLCPQWAHNLISLTLAPISMEMWEETGVPRGNPRRPMLSLLP